MLDKCFEPFDLHLVVKKIKDFELRNTKFSHTQIIMHNLNAYVAVVKFSFKTHMLSCLVILFKLKIKYICI